MGGERCAAAAEWEGETTTTSIVGAGTESTGGWRLLQHKGNAERKNERGAVRRGKTITNLQTPVPPAKIEAHTRRILPL